MQVFEFHFNPKIKEGLIFDSFCYEPENIYEKKFGSLCLVGELKNVLPKNTRLLDNLAFTIKKEYYSKFHRSLEESLKESLKSGNEFLANEVSKENVSWLGNLDFGVISLKPPTTFGQKWWGVNFTKIGNLRILLMRKGQIIDIGKNLEFQDIDPYPLKIFSNIVSGKLGEEDLILVLTGDVFSLFQQENLLAEIARILPFDPKRLKEIFNAKKEKLLKTSGICLLISLVKETALRRKEMITAKFEPKRISLREIFRPVLNIFRKIVKKPYFQFSNFAKKIKFLRWEGIKFPKLKIKKFPTHKLKPLTINKKLLLILALIFFLSLGFLIFQKEREQEIKERQITFNKIQEKVSQAESFLILGETNFQAEKKANSLLKESWEEISPLEKISSTLPVNFRNQVFSLKKSIEESLYQLNKLVIIEEPQPLFEFDSEKFVPQKMIIFNENLYFFNSLWQNLFRINQDGKDWEVIPTDKKFQGAILLDDSILFFSRPNQVINFRNKQFEKTFSLSLPDADSDLRYLSSFKSNLYFIDQKSKELIKYPYLKEFEWGAPQLWFDPKTKKAKEACSLAIDGFLWVLNKDNSIDRYHLGRLGETLEIDLFPYPEDFSKIFTSQNLPYLYLLEPAQNRIVVLNKSGLIIKQFQSEKFDNLLDFAVSKNGKTIFLLNGLKIYQLEL